MDAPDSVIDPLMPSGNYRRQIWLLSAEFSPEFPQKSPPEFSPEFPG
jgi:hypothetical protein